VEVHAHQQGAIQASGIEQCQFNPRDGKFYLNIPKSNIYPDTNNTGSGPGYVLRISGTAPFRVEATFRIDNLTNCIGPQGLAVGPANQLALGCGGAVGSDSLIISDTFLDGTNSTDNASTIIATVTGQGATDEIWYDYGSNHYYFPHRGSATATPPVPGTLGIVDAGNATTLPALDTTVDGNGNTCTGCIPIGLGTGTVSADSLLKLVFVAVRAGMGNTVCSGGIDAFNFVGHDDLGCIAVFQSSTDGDDVSGGITGGSGVGGGGGGNPSGKKKR